MKCKHENVTFTETIPAHHKRIFDGYDNYYCNNDYGDGQLSVEVCCDDCGIFRKLTYRNQSQQPKWIKKRISKMVKDGKWFFSCI